jgi:PBSX family phage terminase large subunit
MLTQHTRVACLREVQSSIKDSVKQLVEDKIKKLGVEPLFKITQVEIVGPNDSLMVFKGLKNQTAASIKSLEGFNRAFVEEAQTISQHSLDMLIPTIRAPGSQLWFGWNPFSPTDPIDKLFEVNKDDPDFVCVPVTYADNPWFPDVLRRDMERDRARDPEKYHHVWLGGYQKNSEARVFRNWKVGTFEVPADARPYYGGDWGFAIDPTVLVRCWIVGRTLYIDQEAYEVGCAIDKTPALFDTVEGARQWPITADSARPETIDYMRRHGYPHIQGARKGPGSLEDGIEFLKSFDIVVHERCKHAISELTHYSYKVDKLTSQVLPVLEDKKNHCIAEGVLVACAHGDIPIEDVREGDMVLTRAGYRRVLFSGMTDVDREIVRIKTTRGEVLCTPDHEVYTSRGFTRADALRYGDEIIDLERSAWGRPSRKWFGTASPIVGILTANAARIASTFADLGKGMMPYFTGMSGQTPMALSHPGTTSTTSTGTPGTTISQILSACLRSSTRRSTPTLRIGCDGNSRISTALGLSPRPGTQVLKGWQSIAKLGDWLTRTSCQFRSHVAIAARRSRPRPPVTGISSAQTPVSQPGGATAGSTTWIASARHAAARIASIATRRRKLVPGRVETVTAGGRCARVYDLTVDGQHEFFAGGVLVSNCIDAIRYAAEQVRIFDGGTVYSTPETDIVIDPITLPKHWPRCWALDIDGSKASILWAAVDRDSDTQYLYAELIVQRHELVLIADAIKTRNKGWGDMAGLFNHLARGRDKMAGDRIVDALLDLRLNLFVVNCTPESAVPEVTRRLSTKRLKVFNTTCPQWLSQYRAYRRNKDGDIVEESDGLMRAMDLLVMEGPGIAGFDEQSMQEARDEWDAGNRSSVTGY